MMNAENRDMNALVNLEARLSKLEKASRRWRLLCFAMIVLGVGMGAKFAVMDAEFGVVKAKRFELTDSKGTAVGIFHVTEDSASLAISSADRKHATVLTPGEEVLRVNK